MSTITVKLRSETRINLSSLRTEDVPDFETNETEVVESISMDETRAREEEVTATNPGVEEEPKKKKKKKDTLDIIFDILERTIEVLIKATPHLLDIIDKYLSAGGDPSDPKLKSLVKDNAEALAYLEEKSRERCG